MEGSSRTEVENETGLLRVDTPVNGATRDRQKIGERAKKGKKAWRQKKLLSSILRRGTVLSAPLDFKVGKNG